MLTDFHKLIKPVKPAYAFRDEGYFVWCGSCVKGDDGLYYLLYSRWPDTLRHDNWVTDCEIAWAVSSSPYGPFRPQGVALKGSGVAGGWDRDCVHNPTIKRFGDRYYLYYMGNYGNGEYWNHRNHQRVGVAIADSPAGPWRRFDRPLIDVNPDSFDALVTSNPSVTQGGDGRYYMIYKAVGAGVMPKGGAVVCGMAVADRPEGPFEKYPEPVMVNPENDWSVEDPYIWYADGWFYALAKDFQGYFTRREKNSTALFVSRDAVSWEPSPTPCAYGLELALEDGGVWELRNLERPQLLFENGAPIALYCAAVEADDVERRRSFNLVIPLGREEERA
ncbi:MAG: glycoside hydrolase family protein [Clostridia bacterium]|nr:glycoside hydrolase family protein [Clostridia bacterium]